MKESTLLEALCSWDEFWRTVETGWDMFGDPRSLNQDVFTKWLNAKVPVSHTGWFTWPTPTVPLAYISEKDVIRLCGGEPPRGYVLLDHAHRVMDWLGFPASEELVWWLFAYTGGDSKKLLPFVRHRVAGIIENLINKLSSVEAIVQQMSLGRLPHSYPDASPPPEYEPRDSSKKGKYPIFDSNLVSPKYRQGLMPEFSKEILNTMDHPIYQIIYAGRFHWSRSATERLATISQLTRQCHEGEIGIEALLEWNWRSEGNRELRSELAEAARDSRDKLQLKRKQVADKIYKQVHGWFRQRGWPIPKCPENWRQEIVKV
ncbi:hypothetical protein ACFLWZ_08820 [Chloroflexota bacterium]